MTESQAENADYSYLAASDLPLLLSHCLLACQKSWLSTWQIRGGNTICSAMLRGASQHFAVMQSCTTLIATGPGSDRLTRSKRYLSHRCPSLSSHLSHFFCQHMTNICATIFWLLSRDWLVCQCRSSLKSSRMMILIDEIVQRWL